MKYSIIFLIPLFEQPNAVQEVIMIYNFWILELFDANNRGLIVFKFSHLWPILASKNRGS